MIICRGCLSSHYDVILRQNMKQDLVFNLSCFWINEEVLSFLTCQKMKDFSISQFWLENNTFQESTTNKHVRLFTSQASLRISNSYNPFSSQHHLKKIEYLTHNLIFLNNMLVHRTQYVVDSCLNVTMCCLKCNLSKIFTIFMKHYHSHRSHFKFQIKSDQKHC